MADSLSWLDGVHSNPIPWLLEDGNPAVRFRTLVDLLDVPQADAEAMAARKAIENSKPVARILEAQWPEGYWVHPGIGYSPKYKATVWQLMFLAQTGACANDQIEHAVEFLLAHGRLVDGTVQGTDVPEARFTAQTGKGFPVACLNGNLLSALTWFGYGDDSRVVATRRATVAQVVRDGFRCRANGRTPSGRRPVRMCDGLPCAWGAIKVMQALLAVPESRRTLDEKAALREGCNFLLSHDLPRADFPSPDGISDLWFRFGFPLGYNSDLLELLAVLGQCGSGEHPAVPPAIELVLSKQSRDGRWRLEHSLRNMWASFERREVDSKWVTLRALRALRRIRSQPE